MDDDAGSGGDAGDVKELALPISVPSSIAGQLFAPADVFDYYSFEGRRGQLFLVEVTSDVVWAADILRGDGTPYQSVFPGPARRLLLDHDDRWLVRVWYPLVGDAPVGYRLSFSALPEAIALATSVPVSRWSGFEVDLREPTAGYATGRVEFGINATNEGGAQLLAQYRLLDQAGNVHERTTWIGLSTSGSGDEIVVQPTPLPEVEAPVALTVELDPLGAWAQMSFQTPGAVTGTVRMLAYRTDTNNPARIAFAGDAAFAATSWSGDELEQWSEGDGGGDRHVAVPGFSSVSGRTRHLDVEGTFVGMFMVFDQSGWIESPDGCRTELINGYDYLVRPTPGRWTFHVDESTGAGLEASHLNLFGLFVPMPFFERERAAC